jgi:glycosyltransferase involved in cell wall biosynthesis
MSVVMNQEQGLTHRVVPRAKFFFEGTRKFFIQGVTYGPFRPYEPGGPFLASPERTRTDFARIVEAGFNVLRVYHTPPRWFMDLAAEHGLRVMTTVPWNKRVLFLDSKETRREIRHSIREAARAHPGHPAVLGFYVDNEIPSDLIRWYGPQRVEQFLDSLVLTVKDEDPGALCAYANFPPTEYLLPKAVDFYSYNVYLHDPRVLSAYLARLQNLAEEKPLVLGEFGMDTIRHSEIEQADLLESHYEAVFRAGLAGTMIFSWTDEWFTDGIDVEDWAFGLVRKDRSPKPAYHRLKNKIIGPGSSVGEKYPLARWPKVSVVVCSYNGAPTLRACLESLGQLNYPDYEVILVDDGSKDNTPEIARDFPGVRTIRQENKGLSVARNVGIEAATGEIVAFTDSDCMADKDWLYYLVQTLVSGPFAAVGGPNVSPPAANRIQAAVAASPGSPSHVLISDTEAEHVPGCNMAYFKSALQEINGFDPEFRKAGDDVDVCWRLMQLGYKIGFSPSAIVWHYRRFTVKAYFGQQKGYGEAESLLRYKHLQYFDSAGSARWKGVIYGQPRFERVFQRPVIYHGIFGTGLFQCIYPRPHSEWSSLVSSLEWVGLTAFILIVSYWFEAFRIVPLIMFACTVMPALSYMIRARLEPKHDTVASRLLVFYLALAQPLARAWARYFTWLREKRTPDVVAASKETHLHQKPSILRAGRLAFWSEHGGERTELLQQMAYLLEEEGWKYALDNGWSAWDVQVFANRWWHVRMKTLTEIYPHGKRLTRLENSLTVSTFSILVGSLLATALAIVGLAAPIWVPYALVCVLVVGGWWLARGLAVRYRLSQLVQAAAIRAKLVPVDR